MTETTRTRRSLLTGAIAAAGAAVLGRASAPATTLASNGDAIVAGQANAATSTTSLSSTAAPALKLLGSFGAYQVDDVPMVEGDAIFARTNVGQSSAIRATATGQSYGITSYADRIAGHFTVRNSTQAGLVAGTVQAASTIDLPAEPYAGIYGYTNLNVPEVAGVIGEAHNTGTGVVGLGDWGVYGTGGVGVMGDVGASGVGVYAFAGDFTAPAPPGGRALYARAGTTSQIALETNGKVRFTGRSARITISAGSTSKKVTMAGVSSSSWVIATLQSKRTGVYVSSVVCSSGYFTIYLNKAPSSTTAIGYLVIN